MAVFVTGLLEVTFMRVLLVSVPGVAKGNSICLLCVRVTKVARAKFKPLESTVATT